MKTYRLYQVGIVNNIPICTLMGEVQATDESTAEELLLAGMPNDGIEYLITVVK